MKRSALLKRFVPSAAVLLAGAALALAAADKPAGPKKVKRIAPTTRPAGPSTKPKADRPFNGKDLKGWVTKRRGSMGYWTVGTAALDKSDPRKFVVLPKGKELINARGGGVDLYSKYVHGDAIIKIEVMVPKGSNSGIYVHGEYEIQILDSYGRDKRPGAGDMGAIYGAAPPKKPKYKKPGEWSQYEIHFRAPRFDASGKKRIARAMFLKVILNGRVIHQNLRMKGPTPGGVDGKEKPKGPLMFQGNHGPVAFRNIEIIPVKWSKPPAGPKPKK